MVVDCKPLADVLCGRVFLTDGTLRPIFVRMARFVARMCGAGRRPPIDIAPYVEWRPRRFNPVAGFLCNVPRNSRASAEYVHTDALQSALAHGHNLQLYSDGGWRRGLCGATAWIVYSVRCCGQHLLWSRLAWRTIFLEASDAHSSIQSEALALEDGINFLSSFRN